jgi:pSer/pThr/pTyr-binding forkhead associated (FHA) protein
MSGVQAKFFCKTGAFAGSDQLVGDHATIGRGPDNTIVLSDDVVSQTHACIAFDPTSAAYFLEDLDSTNGTRLDGIPVSGRQRLGDLHVVTFGEQHDFIFVVLPDEGRQRERAERLERRRQEPAPQPVEPVTWYEPPPALDMPPLGVQPEPPEAEPAEAPAHRGARHEQPKEEAAVQSAEPATRYEPPPALDVPPLGGTSAKQVGVTIEIAIGDGNPHRVTLTDGRHVAGRAKDCAVPIDDATLSRRHAAFVVRGGVVTVTDLKSLNGTFIEETPVETPTSVEIGQTVTFGNRVRIVRIAS